MSVRLRKWQNKAGKVEEAWQVDFMFHHPDGRRQRVVKFSPVQTRRGAEQFPPTRYPGMDVLVGGVSFDALQVGVRVLWEIKKEMIQIEKQRKAAAACGYGYVVGVSTEAHKAALLEESPTLHVVVTGCTR